MMGDEAVKDWAFECRQAMAERDKLRAALKPFADLANSYSASCRDQLRLYLDEVNDGHSTYAFTLGDLRRASEVLR